MLRAFLSSLVLVLVYFLHLSKRQKLPLHIENWRLPSNPMHTNSSLATNTLLENLIDLPMEIDESSAKVGVDHCQGMQVSFWCQLSKNFPDNHVSLIALTIH